MVAFIILTMGLSREENQRAKNLLAGIDLSRLNEGRSESKAAVPIKDIVFRLQE